MRSWCTCVHPCKFTVFTQYKYSPNVLVAPKFKTHPQFYFRILASSCIPFYINLLPMHKTYPHFLAWHSIWDKKVRLVQGWYGSNGGDRVDSTYPLLQRVKRRTGCPCCARFASERRASTLRRNGVSTLVLIPEFYIFFFRKCRVRGTFQPQPQKSRSWICSTNEFSLPFPKRIRTTFSA